MKRDLTPRVSAFAGPVLLFTVLIIAVAWRQTTAHAAPVFQGVLTYHNDNGRSGHNPYETTLTLKNVNSTQFGKLFTLSTDGLVDAEPLYAPGLTVAGATHNVLFVESEHDTVYGFDADTGATLWQVTTLESGEVPSDNRGCGQVTPEIGITSTPVIDLKAGPHGTIYLVAMSKDSSGNYHQRLHALDVTTGAEEFGGPMDVVAQYPGTGRPARTALLFSTRSNIRSGGRYCSWTTLCTRRGPRIAMTNRIRVG